LKRVRKWRPQFGTEEGEIIFFVLRKRGRERKVYLFKRKDLGRKPSVFQELINKALEREKNEDEEKKIGGMNLGELTA